jgi:HD-GYP domain-containing protein (c-di-GMP phosphodiesterase class II)
MVLAKPIYANNGVIMLREGTKLTQQYIERIQYLKLPYIYIQDDISAGIEIDEVISEETKLETRKALSDSIAKMKKGYFDVNQDIVQNVESIINDVTSNPRVMVSVQEIRNKDEYLHMHSINVCVLSLLIAKKRGYNDTQLKHLALGALLHDLGKTKIDKIDPTTYRESYSEKEYDDYKDHVRLGYEMIKEIPNSSLLAANVALTHHEKYDGTGFPIGKKNEGIHEFSRIVAIANEYDNLVYNSPEDMNLAHYEIIELIVSRAYTWFDPEMVRIFRSSISPYPVGSGVELSDGRRGIVSGLNENLPTRPLVRIVNPAYLDDVIEEVDLSKNLSIVISAEIDIDELRQ